MEAPQSTSELLEQLRDGLLFPPGSAVEGTEGIEDLAKLLERHAHPDFVTMMVPKEGPAIDYRGVEGLKQALGDWITPYEDFRLVIDRVIVGDASVLFLVRQVGTTKHGGVAIETPSGAVWSVHEDKIRKASFYIDPREAFEAAGIDPADHT
jgi:ketosteroid isomerase-like protein